MAALLCALTASAAIAADGVAVAAPLSGPYAALGAAVRAGTSAEQNGDATTFADDRCQAAAAVEAAKALVATKPSIVIGHPCSSAAIAAAPVYAAAHIPFIAVGARHPDLTAKRAGPLVFRLSGRDDRQGAAAADALRRLSGGRPIALLHDRTFAMSSIAADAVKGLAGTVAEQFPFVASEFDYDTLTAKVAAFAGAPSNVGAILFAGYPAEAIVILKGLRAKGVTAPFIGVEALAVAEFGQALAAGKLADAFVLRSVHAGPGAIEHLAHAAIVMWREARAARPQDPASALSEVAANDPHLGRVAFDSNGDAVLPSYALSAWKDAAWAVAEPEPVIPVP